MEPRIVTGYIGPIRYQDLRLGALVRAADGPCDWRVQRLTQLELLGFVAAMVDGRIFCAEYVQPADDLYCVFPASAFLLQISREARAEIGTLYEFRDRANGTARNGQPSFPTVQFIHREDWARAKDMIAAEMLRREKHQ